MIIITTENMCFILSNFIKVQNDYKCINLKNKINFN